MPRKHDSSNKSAAARSTALPFTAGPAVRATLDDTDLAILRTLQANGRATYTEIGKAAGLSAPAAHDRVHRLEERGVIRGYRAEIDPEVLGFGVLALVSVIPSDSSNMASLEAAFAAIEPVEAA